MNVRELIEKVKDLSLSIPIVKSFDDTDPYSYWNSNEVKYGSVIFAIKTGTIINNMIRYSCVIYYGDRIVEDESNVNNIYVDAERVISRVINLLDVDNEIVQVITQSPVITYFTQKFTDNLAGAYCNFTIETVLDSTCNWTIPVTPAPEINDNNNENIPSQG